MIALLDNDKKSLLSKIIKSNNGYMWEEVADIGKEKFDFKLLKELAVDAQIKVSIGK